MSDPESGAANQPPYILKYYEQFRAESGDNSPYIPKRDYIAPDGGTHRFTHAGVGHKGKRSGGLSNEVDAPVIQIHEHEVEPEPIEGAGNIFFETDARTLDGTVSGVEGISNANLEQIVDVLYEHPDFKLELAGYADRVGDDAYNQKLSADRLDVVREEIGRLYIQRGLEGASENEIETKTASLRAEFDAKIKLNTEQKTGFEETARKQTADGVAEQLNRSVAISYVVPPGEPEVDKTYSAHKGADTDNHSHTVVIPVDGLGSSRYLIKAQPKITYNTEAENFVLAEKNVHVVMQVSAAERFFVDLDATEDRVAKEYRFLVEADDINDVGFAYNEAANAVTMSYEGAEIVIQLRDGVHPEFSVGVIAQNGEVNLVPIAGYTPKAGVEAKVEPSIYARKLASFRDDIVAIAEDANGGADPSALGARIEDAFKNLRDTGINQRALALYKDNLSRTYADADSPDYKPGELTYPGEVYISLGQYCYDVAQHKDLASTHDMHQVSLFENHRKIPDAVKADVRGLLDDVGLGDLHWQNDLSKGMALVVDSMRRNDDLAQAFNKNADGVVQRDKAPEPLENGASAPETNGFK